MTVALDMHTWATTAKVVAAVFEHRYDGFRVWWSWSDLYSVLALKLAPGSGAAWFQKRRQRILAHMETLGLGAGAVRLSVPYGGMACGPLRCLPWVGFSTPALLGLLARCVHPPSRHHGRLLDEGDRRKLLAFLQSLLKSRSEFDFVLCFDVHAVRLGSSAVGASKAKVCVRSGLLQVGHLLDVARALDLPPQVLASGWVARFHAWPPGARRVREALCSFVRVRCGDVGVQAVLVGRRRCHRLALRRGAPGAD